MFPPFSRWPYPCRTVDVAVPVGPARGIARWRCAWCPSLRPGLVRGGPARSCARLLLCQRLPRPRDRVRPAGSDTKRTVPGYPTPCVMRMETIPNFWVLPLTLLPPPQLYFRSPSVIVVGGHFSCAVWVSILFFLSSTAAPRSRASLLLFMRSESSGYQKQKINRGLRVLIGLTALTRSWCCCEG